MVIRLQKVQGIFSTNFYFVDYRQAPFQLQSPPAPLEVYTMKQQILTLASNIVK